MSERFADIIRAFPYGAVGLCVAGGLLILLSVAGGCVIAARSRRRRARRTPTKKPEKQAHPTRRDDHAGVRAPFASPTELAAVAEPIRKQILFWMWCKRKDTHRDRAQLTEVFRLCPGEKRLKLYVCRRGQVFSAMTLPYPDGMELTPSKRVSLCRALATALPVTLSHPDREMDIQLRVVPETVGRDTLELRCSVFRAG